MYENLRLLPDDRIAIVINRCGLCGGFIEGVEYGLAGEEVDSLDSLLYKLKMEPDTKINFKFMNMQCPSHKKLVPHSTWKRFSDEEVEKICQTPLSKIYMTIIEK